MLCEYNRKKKQNKQTNIQTVTFSFKQRRIKNIEKKKKKKSIVS